jgi:hypothetical protein
MDKIAVIFLLVFIVIFSVLIDLTRSEANDGWVDDCLVIGKHRYDGRSYSCKPE